MNAKIELDIRKITPEALGMLGTPQIAYVRPIEVEGNRVIGIFAANGQQIGLSPDREQAFVAVRQHDMEPLSVH